MTQIKAVVGLGNPGDKYAKTLHNIGFWYTDELLRAFAGASFSKEKKLHGEQAVVQCSAGPYKGERIVLLKPDTFMNDSGRAVTALCQFYKIKPQEILVAHDELDLPPGTVKMKQGGGHGGHNGLRSIIQHVGADFMRLRLGIGHPGHKEQVLSYVLNPARKEQQPALDDMLGRSAKNFDVLMQQGWNIAQQQLHSSNP